MNNNLKYKVQKNERESLYFGVIPYALILIVVGVFIYGAIQFKSHIEDKLAQTTQSQSTLS